MNEQGAVGQPQRSSTLETREAPRSDPGGFSLTYCASLPDTLGLWSMTTTVKITRSPGNRKLRGSQKPTHAQVNLLHRLEREHRLPHQFGLSAYEARLRIEALKR